MNIWQRLTRFEKKIERGPKKNLVKLLTFVFGLSFLGGIFISVGLQTFQIKTIEQTIEEIRLAEKRRMDARIETLRKLHYGRGI